MDLLNFIFRLGVVFAIFGFIWGLINIVIRLLTAGRKRETTEIYILKAVQYLLLVDVTFLICFNSEVSQLDFTSKLVYASIILLMYFVGKLQKNKSKQTMFRIYTNGMAQGDFGFNIKAEITVIALSILAFIGFCLYPNIADNPLSNWFVETILDIEDTPIFGFVFKVIGFFFLINILLKVFSSIMLLLTGQAFSQNKPNDPNDRDQPTKFDDYEEIN